MSLTPASALVLGLGSRLVSNLLFRSPDQRLNSSTSDLVVQGLWQGALVFYVHRDYESFAPALAVGLLARMLLDFASSSDPLKLVYTLGSALLGILIAFILTEVLEDDFSFSQESIALPPRRRRRIPASLTPSAREGRSDARSEVSTVPVKRHRDRSIGRAAATRRGRRDRILSKATREPSPARRAPSTLHQTVTVTDGSSETVELYTGLGRLVDMQLSHLRKRAASAEAHRRRCKEERKWALAQGNKARASQLGWQVSRYAALNESYTREADRRIIQATKNDVAGTTNMMRTQHEEMPPMMNMHDNNGFIHGGYVYETQPPPVPQFEPQYTHVEKGKAPMYAYEWNMMPPRPMPPGMGWNR